MYVFLTLVFYNISIIFLGSSADYIIAILYADSWRFRVCVSLLPVLTSV